MTVLPVWQHWDAMVAASRSVLGCSDDAYDCVAEAMAQVLEREPAGVVNLEAFMVTVARRRALDRVRSRQRSDRGIQLLAAQLPLSAPDVAELVAARAEAAWADEQARLMLKPHVYRLVRLLADGVPMSEAARRLGLSDRSAESHLLRARRTLRKAMAQALVVLGGGFACGRRLVPATSPAVVVAVAAATAAIVAAAPSPDQPEAAEARPQVTNTVAGPARDVVTPAKPAAERPARQAATRTARAGGASAAPRPAASAPARTTLATTPAGGLQTYEYDDGHQSDGPVETVMHCVENLTVTVGYQGC